MIAIHNKTDTERIKEYNALLNKYRAGKHSIEKRCIAAENWWRLRNSAEEMKQAQGLSGFKAVSGWLHNVIVSKHADGMDAYPQPNILPREPGDRAAASALGKILPVVLEQNDFEQVYSDVLWQKLKTGTGVYRVVWDGDRLGGLGDIAISRVDLLSLFWEPGLGDIQQSPYLFYTAYQDNEELTARYPQLRGRLGSDAFRPSRFAADDPAAPEGKSLVVEVWYKKPQGGRKILHCCRYVGDVIIYDSEALRREQAPALRWAAPLTSGGKGELGMSFAAGASPRPTTGTDGSEALRREQAPALRWEAPLTRGGEEACEGEAVGGSAGIYAHGLYPFVFDCLFPVEASPCGYGFIDLCRNPQTQIDLLQTAFIKNTLVGAVPRYFRRIDGAVNDSEFLDLDRALVTVDGNLGEDCLRPIDYKPLSGNYLEVRQNVINELRETSGNTETSSGVPQGGVTAASAIAALQEASGKGSRDAARSGYRAYSQVVKLCIELMRQFYSLPRCFRITGELGAEKFVSFSNEGLQLRPLYSDSGLELGQYLPVFDIKVRPQRQSPYNRLSQNELALQFYSLGFFEPDRAESALGCLEMMDFEGRDALMQRISAAAGRRQRFEALRLAAMKTGRLSMPPEGKAALKAAGAPIPGGDAL